VSARVGGWGLEAGDGRPSWASALVPRRGKGARWLGVGGLGRETPGRCAGPGQRQPLGSANGPGTVQAGGLAGREGAACRAGSRGAVT
jgi:hypothetical protein